MESYSEDFYRQRYNEPVPAYRDVLAYVLELFPDIASAVDVGCGAGNWLAALRQLGVENITGIDGNWVPQNYSHIPPECFVQHDIATSFPPVRRCDLVISLEVAEHLTPERAQGFVAYLTQCADRVLFSAALPKQGGDHHCNEQLPSYWAQLFATHDFVLHDVLRPRFWNHPVLPIWYKQNMFIYTRKNITIPHVQTPPLIDIVHPEFYWLKLERFAQQFAVMTQNISTLSRRVESLAKANNALQRKNAALEAELQKVMSHKADSN